MTILQRNLLLGLGSAVVMAAALLLVTTKSSAPYINQELSQECHAAGTCGAKSFWRHPEKARRFAEVFKS